MQKLFERKEAKKNKETVSRYQEMVSESKDIEVISGTRRKGIDETAVLFLGGFFLIASAIVFMHCFLPMLPVHTIVVILCSIWVAGSLYRFGKTHKE